MTFSKLDANIMNMVCVNSLVLILVIHVECQHIRESGSPTSISIIWVLPNPVYMKTIHADSSRSSSEQA